MVSIDPNQVLIFATGASGIQSVGFDPADNTHFTVVKDNDTDLLPTCTTCSNILNLKVNKKTVNPTIFMRLMAEALANNFFLSCCGQVAILTYECVLTKRVKYFQQIVQIRKVIMLQVSWVCQINDTCHDMFGFQSVEKSVKSCQI